MIVDDSALLHAKAYDPQKAREYYLRTRQLKGRRPGQGQPQTASQPKVASVTSVKPKSNAKRLRADAQARVAALEARLDRLKNVLAELVKQAKVRSGAEPESDKSPAEQQKDAKGKSPKTAKQKRDAAKKAKETYEKNKKSGTESKDAADVAAEIKEVQEKIAKVREEIKAAIAKAREKSASSQTDKPKVQSQTASKGR